MDEKVPRVKPGQQYEWFQDNRSIRVRLEIKGISSKKIDVSTSDLTLKVNVQEKNYVKLFDLENEIDYLSKENTVVYANDILEITLIKKDQSKNWSKLVAENLTKEELRKRREESFQRKELQESQFKKQLSDLKIKYDSHATREQMKQEDEQRKILDQKKKEEKEKAEQEIYSGFAEKFETNQQQSQPEVLYARKVPSDIFSNDDIKKYEKDLDEFEERYPKVRQQKKVDLQFTEKIYPNVATREQHFKDAPLPKIKQGNKSSKVGSDLDNKNPLWLKDKGDEFLNNKDFYSAMNAYSQALRIDPNQVLCIANRSIIHLNLFNYDECISDSNLVLDFIAKQSKEDQESKYLKLAQKQKLRKAMAISWKGNVQDGIKLCDDILKEKMEESAKQQVEQAKEIMNKRIESNKQKQIGDLQFQQAQYEKTLETYKNALQNDENEIILGNMSQCYVKLEDYPQCIEYCDKSIAKVKQLIRYSNFNPNFKQSSYNSNNFLMRLYLRKASSYSILGKIQEGLTTIKQALQIDELSQDARKIHEKLEKQVNKVKFTEFKQQAAQQVNEKNYSGALDVYNQALQLIDAQDDTIDYLSILLNRCACYVHLNQYEDIISTSLRGLKIIRSYKNSILGFDSKKSTKEYKEKLQSFEIRFLTRRANAYLQQKLIYNAKLDLEEAYKLDPNNQQIKDDLDKLQSNIK